MITVPTPPVANKSIFKCLDSPLGHEWEQALYHQYDKNDNVKLVAQPTPIENVPPDKKVLRTVISTKVKKKGDSLYQLVTRMCADGSKQEAGIDYEFSYSPTAGAAPIRITISIAASEDLTVAIIDVVNCFQSTLIPEDERVIISMPPLYRKWFTQKYPNVKWEHSPSGKYVLQLLNGLQGDKSIGRKWYLLLKKLLENFGFVPCIQEQSLFIYEKDDGKMILNTSTDDFLCAYSNELIFESLCKHLEQYFDITTKTGMLLKYLNVRIIQSEHGISLDQSEHIQDHIINKYFPPAKIEDSHLKKVHTPFRTMKLIYSKSYQQHQSSSRYLNKSTVAHMHQSLEPSCTFMFGRDLTLDTQSHVYHNTFKIQAQLPLQDFTEYFDTSLPIVIDQLCTLVRKWQDPILSELTLIIQTLNQSSCQMVSSS